MPKIKIFIEGIVINAELYNTDCGMKIYQSLPIESIINEWGDEFYFSVPVVFKNDHTATKVVKAGDICYWPPGRALCIFFGPTPISTNDDPLPASEVNIVGRILDDPKIFKKMKGSKNIRIEDAENALMKQNCNSKE